MLLRVRCLGETPTPHRGTGILPVQVSHGQSCPCPHRRGRRRNAECVCSVSVPLTNRAA
ncbi:MAG: hypothetical protein NZ874_03110 [Fimbriimonadales bacterium]|nr:hypothetical protein [Fimbriimonadales bacterium]